MNRKINLLMIAYVFPPALGSGTFRALSFANNLRQRGFRVHVLTASDYTLDNSAVDTTLCEKLDPQVEVYRARRYRSPKEFLLKFRDRLRQGGKKSPIAKHAAGTSPGRPSRLKFLNEVMGAMVELFSYPDNQIGWASAALLIGRRVIRERDIDVVFATGGPWSSILTAILLKTICRTPVVLDFRDPWVSNPNNLDRLSIIKTLNRKMERFCVRNSDAVIANTEELRQDFLNRYSFLSPARIHTITNGIGSLYAMQTPKRERFTITHAGTLYLNRNPKKFLMAVRDIVAETHIPENQIQVNFVGSLTIKDDEELASLMTDKHLIRIVQSIPQVSHDKALEYQSMADVLMLIQPNFPLQVPRKLYEYLAFQRPILAITEEDGATASIIRRAGVGIVVGNEVSEIKAAIMKLYQDWVGSARLEIPRDRLRQFDNDVLADRLRDILKDQVIGQVRRS